jgi:hypothetical protein|tara:strand:- start:149 stop:331 length:183 start_codon:yes stop_codon:yes gene_type:complete
MRAAAIFPRTAQEIFELPFAVYVSLNEEEPEIALKVQITFSCLLGARLCGVDALIWELDS